MTGILLVRDVMIPAVKTVKPEATVKEAVGKMNKFSIGSVVVVDVKKPIGILTERDILRRIVEPGLDPETISVRQVMSSPVITIEYDVSIEEAGRLMANKGIKKLPVVRKGQLVGIITSTDIVRAGPGLLKILEDLMWRRKGV